jgi:hypothetical protein
VKISSTNKRTKRVEEEEKTNFTPIQQHSAIPGTQAEKRNKVKTKQEEKDAKLISKAKSTTVETATPAQIITNKTQEENSELISILTSASDKFTPG